MSGLARIMLKKNIPVSGSDLALSYVTEGLINEGAAVSIGHSSSNITSGMTVVYSSDIKADNPELQQAKFLNCTLLHRSELLQQLMHGYKTLAVAGTHGKTTTTALLTTVLVEAQLDPCFAVGGILPNFKTNAGYGKGEYFVAEADESDGTFLKYLPWGAIVTNIDTDHMDHFKSETNLNAAFNDFINKVSSTQNLFWCGDDKKLQALNPPGISYGFGNHNRLQITDYQQHGWKINFDLMFQGKHYQNIELPLVGKHNALNACAVFGLALSLGIPDQSIRNAFTSFRGILRRCEIKAEFQSVTIIDDYAHHPTEVLATLKGIRRAIGEKRLIAVFQPHRYTRTKECLGTYGQIFDVADEVVVTDIFSAGEKPIGNLDAGMIVQEIKAASNIPCRHVPRSVLAASLSEILRPHDVVVGLGAGDITKLAAELTAIFKDRSIPKLKVGLVHGGKSQEHDVSVISAKRIIDNINPQYYEVTRFSISRNGRWSDESADNLNSHGHHLSPAIIDKLNQCDIVFPILHGTNGEDGIIQGFLQMLGIAYVGCDCQSSAISMDKAVAKKLMILNGVPTAPFIDFSHHDWNSHPETLIEQIHQQLHYPLYVKPVHLGSSIGVSKVNNEKELKEAINKVFLLDRHVIIENGMNIREIEFAVFGNDEPIVLPPGEVFANGKLYDYNSKYSENGSPTTPKADLTEEQIRDGIYLVKTAYQAAGCSGLARIDCFLDQEGKLWFNEINPIPGLTPNSLYPKMIEANGISMKELIDMLIIMGMQKKRQRDRCDSTR